MGEVSDSEWDRAAMRRLRAGEIGVLDGRPLMPVLQHAGRALLEAGAADNDNLIRRCLAGLQERDDSGDGILAMELLAEVGDQMAGEQVAWPLIPAPIDLELLAGCLDGDPLQGDGAVDLQTGNVYPPGTLDWDRPDELDEDSETFDPDRWLYFRPESGPGYRDMVDFAAALPDGRLREDLFLSLEGRGAFRRFRNVLNDQAHQDQLTRWTLFRDERQLGRARDWLAQEGYRCLPQAGGRQAGTTTGI